MLLLENLMLVISCSGKFTGSVEFKPQLLVPFVRPLGSSMRLLSCFCQSKKESSPVIASASGHCKTRIHLSRRVVCPTPLSSRGVVPENSNVEVGGSDGPFNPKYGEDPKRDVEMVSTEFSDGTLFLSFAFSATSASILYALQACLDRY